MVDRNNRFVSSVLRTQCIKILRSKCDVRFSYREDLQNVKCWTYWFEPSRPFLVTTSYSRVLKRICTNKFAGTPDFLLFNIKNNIVLIFYILVNISKTVNIESSDDFGSFINSTQEPQTPRLLSIPSLHNRLTDSQKENPLHFSYLYNFCMVEMLPDRISGNYYNGLRYDLDMSFFFVTKTRPSTVPYTKNLRRVKLI